jgi:ABC-type polysaccharide/polyol phosphate export permease
LKNEAIKQLMNLNPLVSIIGLVREPIVEGHVPTVGMYCVACTTILIAATAAVLTLWRLQRRLIFHL